MLRNSISIYHLLAKEYFFKGKNTPFLMLYDILSDRRAVNLLKLISEDKMPETLPRRVIHKLAKANLVLADQSSIIISIKGQAFLKQLDELHKIIENSRKSSIQIVYSLKKEEKEILLLLAKQPMKDLLIYRSLKKILRGRKTIQDALQYLEETNMIERNGAIFITNFGRKIIKEEILSELNLSE